MANDVARMDVARALQPARGGLESPPPRRSSHDAPAATRYPTGSGSSRTTRVKGEYLKPGSAPANRAQPKMQARTKSSTPSQNHRERARRRSRPARTRGRPTTPTYTVDSTKLFIEPSSRSPSQLLSAG